MRRRTVRTVRRRPAHRRRSKGDGVMHDAALRTGRLRGGGSGTPPGRRVRGLVGGVLAGALLAGAAAASDLSGLSDAELAALLARIDGALAAPPRVATLGVASGFGLPRGAAVLSAAATDRRERRAGRRDFDGSVAAALGLGTLAGWQATAVLGLTSVTPSEFADSGTLGVQFSRGAEGQLGRGQSSVAVGFGNLLRWGDSRDLRPSAFVAASTVQPLGAEGGATVMATLGYGSAVAGQGRRPAAFAAAGVGLRGGVAASLGWAGDEVVGGVTFWPGASGRAQVSLGVGDVTNRLGGRRLLVSVSLGVPGLFGSAAMR